MFQMMIVTLMIQMERGVLSPCGSSKTQVKPCEEDDLTEDVEEEEVLK